MQAYPFLNNGRKVWELFELGRCRMVLGVWKSRCKFILEFLQDGWIVQQVNRKGRESFGYEVLANLFFNEVPFDSITRGI